MPSERITLMPPIVFVGTALATAIIFIVTRPARSISQSPPYRSGEISTIRVGNCAS
jgi:hypothetical protein